MINRDEVDVTIHWAKVTYNGQTKRINRPSQDFFTFIGQVKSHFAQLAELDYLYNVKGK